MISPPLVSIVIPTYNQKEQFLRECIESASSQTYKNIEIVISDNHSTNNAKSIIRNLPPKYTAGLARVSVNCFKREPRPPERISATVFLVNALTKREDDKSCCIFASPDL